MPPTNRRGAARHTPDQQPSLLDQLELDEDPGREDDRQSGLKHENPGHEEDDQRDGKAAAEIAQQHPGEDGDRAEQPPEPLQRAYARYVEIINDTYNSKFSDAKRQAAFKEAAKAHGVRMTDLKHYSTAAALGIPYHGGADADPEPGDAPLDAETD